MAVEKRFLGVETLADRGGNATGFIQFDHTLAGKFLEPIGQNVPILSLTTQHHGGGTPALSAEANHR